MNSFERVCIMSGRDGDTRGGGGVGEINKGGKAGQQAVSLLMGKFNSIGRGSTPKIYSSTRQKGKFLQLAIGNH